MWEKHLTPDIFSFKKIGFLSPSFQIVLIVGLFVLNTVLDNSSFRAHGYVGAFNYPLMPMLVFAPIYEEIIFRGGVVLLMQKIYSLKTAIIIACLLFGLWHLKNIFFLPQAKLIQQIAYAALLVGPILSLVMLKTKSIWPGVILHYLNNVVAYVAVPLTSVLVTHLLP